MTDAAALRTTALQNAVLGARRPFCSFVYFLLASTRGPAIMPVYPKETPAAMNTNTTPALAKLTRYQGTAHYARMSDVQLRRIYCAAWRAHAAVFGADSTRGLVEHARSFVTDTTLVAAHGRAAVAHTSAFVGQVIGELSSRDTVVIPASPESREWSSMEGGHRIFHATEETVTIVERFMAA